MKVIDQGAFFTVICSKADVRDFASRWPCFGRIKPYSFTFDKVSGDLIDTNHRDGETDNAGILALSDDAKSFGLSQLKEEQH